MKPCSKHACKGAVRFHRRFDVAGRQNGGQNKHHSKQEKSGGGCQIRRKYDKNALHCRQHFNSLSPAGGSYKLKMTLDCPVSPTGCFAQPNKMILTQFCKAGQHSSFFIQGPLLDATSRGRFRGHKTGYFLLVAACLWTALLSEVLLTSLLTT